MKSLLKSNNPYSKKKYIFSLKKLYRYKKTFLSSQQEWKKYFFLVVSYQFLKESNK